MSKHHDQHGHGVQARPGGPPVQGGHGGVRNYGVVKGHAVEGRPFPPRSSKDQPHFHIHLVGSTGGHADVAVNILSRDRSQVLFRVDPHFAPQKAADLLALSDGSHRISAGDSPGLGLDYLRQHLVSRDQMDLLPIDPDNLDNDLHNGLADLVGQAIQDASSLVFAFGSNFADSDGPNPFFGFSPDVGIHDVHMNQGNPSSGPFAADNGVNQDGALLFYFPARQQWCAVFLAFQSQSWSSNDRSGVPAPSASPTRLVRGRLHPLVLTDPADFHATPDPVELEHIEGTLHPVPPPRRSPPVMNLAEVIGHDAVQEIEQAGQIVLHAVGDTGNGEHTPQTVVAGAMAQDYHRPNPADHPAFFLHLGDVIYGHQKDLLYRDQFYRAYNAYPGKIVALAGNHDGETFPGTDPDTLRAFLANFCTPEPAHAPIAGSMMRKTGSQPGVYFLLKAPFVRVLALYSNSAEGPGFISGGRVGDAQKKFLVEQLREVARLRGQGETAALLLAVHHPPYSAGGHSGSEALLADLDDAIRQAGAAPDAVLSGHAHNYQRFTRQFLLNGATLEIPYLVAGGGGVGVAPIQLAEDLLPVQGPLDGRTGDHSLRQYYTGYGYLTVTVTRRVLTIDFFAVPAAAAVPVDSVTVDLRTRRVVHELPPMLHPMQGEVQGG